MTIDDLKNQGIPLIGFGPGIAGYNPNIKKQYRGISRYYHAVLRRINYRITCRKYVNSVVHALRLGYRLIDYSTSYGDGKLINKAIQKSGVKREELFITTRISNGAQRNGKVREEFFRFLKNVNLEYVDLLQFHWPVTGFYIDTWREMEKLYDEGYVKHLGVANCHQHHLEEIFKICKYRPEIGQFEIHPLFTQKPLIKYYKDNDIVVEAYTPVARFDDRLIWLPLLKEISKRYNKKIVQVILRWHVQNGVIPVVRTLSYQHQKDNLDIFDFELSDDEMKAIDAININSRLRYDPDNCDFAML